MIRAVLDVNVFVSALISPGGPPGRILDAWLEQRFLLVTSETIIAELRRVTSEPRLARRYGLTQGEVERLLAELPYLAIITPGSVEVQGVARHAEDDKLLACAVEGGAGYLVTGDNHLLSLGAFEGVTIVSPGDFEKLLDVR